jgi:serine/threonine protein kinase
MPDVLRTVGRYEILSEVGRGGMAYVYRARQVDLGRNVALKELSAFHAADPMVAERFVRESRVAASLSHPNIVTVHDFFQEHGTPYIAMEYLERGSLRGYMKRLDLPQVAGVLEGLLAGLTHAEAAEIVHRDLKPENLLVTSDGSVKIADFGIAKAQRSVAAGPALTATGSTVGTPTYMAPEQAMARDIGPWTDLYSVGVMAYEMLAGRLPFPDEDTPMAVLLHHINDPVPPLRSADPRIDPAVASWVESLLEKDTARRTRSAYEAWNGLEETIIDVAGPLWRRRARLLTKLETGETPDPLTPAPFESTHRTPTPESAQVASAGPSTSGFVTFRRPRRAQAPPANAAPPVEAPAAASLAPADTGPTDGAPMVSDEQPQEAPLLARAETPPEDVPMATTAAPRQPLDVEPEPAPMTSRAQLPTSEARSRAGRLRLGVAAALAVTLAVAGYLVGRSGSESEPPAVRPLAAGPLRLTYPATWSKVADAPELGTAGVSKGVAIGPPRSGRRLVAGVVDEVGPTMLPDALTDRLSSAPPAPSDVRIGEVEALRYRGLRIKGSPTELTLFAVPTTAGVATVVCIAHPAELRAFERECEGVAASARLREGRQLGLGPSADYAASVSATVGRLDQARAAGSAWLAKAKTAAAQTKAAEELEHAYGTAAGSLARLRPGPAERRAHARIVAAFVRGGKAYTRLASAARRRNRRGYSSAATAVERSEQAARRALRDLRELGYVVR